MSQQVTKLENRYSNVNKNCLQQILLK